ncbi:MAG: hypothetical protein OEZ39_15660 [Gammaproteobacteria bacterium]|nr:hypothetical protein [Gammaproteobacteria bacterium]MDH5653293.1 hypothetical protein [Gammaproteobacteria bacterium]
MAEINSDIYYKHNDPQVMKKLDDFFTEGRGDEDALIDMALVLNPTKGESVAQILIDTVDDPEYDLSVESLDHTGGYSVAHFVHGSSGDEIVEAIVEFLNLLIPDINAQAWGCGDDDPWEFWIKYENGKIVRKDDAPFEEEDEDIKNTIYKWWHIGMPESITAGLLNEDYD